MMSHFTSCLFVCFNCYSLISSSYCDETINSIWIIAVTKHDASFSILIMIAEVIHVEADL
jgi:hypothetical protein